MMYELHARLGSEWEVRAVAPRFPGWEAFDAAREAPATTRCAYWGTRFKVSYLPLTAAALAAAREFPPDLVACDQVDSGWAALAVRRRHGTPFAVFAFGFELGGAGAPLKRIVYRRAARVIGCSAHAARAAAEFAGVEAGRTAVVYPGVDHVRFEGGDAAAARARLRLDGRRVVLTVARLARNERYKGHDSVIRAFPSILAKHPDAVYVIAGDGDLRPELERMAADHGLGETVRFAGAVPDSDLRDLYAAADTVVMVSRQAEGFGIVYLEAAAARKPVVYTALGGAAEAVADGETGLAVPPDDPPAVAAAITRLLDDPALAAALGERAHERAVSRFSWEAGARSYLHVLESCLQAETTAA